MSLRHYQSNARTVTPEQRVYWLVRAPHSPVTRRHTLVQLYRDPKTRPFLELEIDAEELAAVRAST